MLKLARNCLMTGHNHKPPLSNIKWFYFYNINYVSEEWPYKHVDASAWLIIHSNTHTTNTCTLYIEIDCIRSFLGNIPACLKNPLVVMWFSGLPFVYRSSVTEIKTSLECPMCRHPVKNYKALCGHMKMHGGWDKSKVQM